MKRQTKLAFDMLEMEMECIAIEEQPMYKGGTGEVDYGSGSWVATGSGIWDVDVYSSGFYSSGYYGYYGTGYYASGDYSTGFYGSGIYGSGDYGSGPMDPGQLMDNYVDSSGGWANWSGGFISGVGYMGATTTIYGSSGSGIMDGLEAAISGLCTAAGLTSSMTSAVCSAVYGNEWTSLSFQNVSGTLKLVGKLSGAVDIALNIGEIGTDQTAVENLEDLGQIAVGLVGFLTEEEGIGFGIQLGVTAWEMEELADGR